MFKFVVVVASIVASAQAGFLHGAPALATTYAAAPLATSYAAGPALGAPLLGSVSYNAPETTIVRQPVVVDQPEVHYRQVPYTVQTAPIVKTVQPVIQAAPVVHHHQTYVAPAPVVQAYAAAPVVQYAAAPAIVKTVQPALAYAAAPALVRSGGFSYGYSAPAFNGQLVNRGFYGGHNAPAFF